MKLTGVIDFKNEISHTEEVDIIETVCVNVIGRNESGVYYTPYDREYGLIIGVAKNLITGIEFEENDDILGCVLENEELKSAVKRCIDVNVIEMSRIDESIDDIVAFRKTLFANSHSSIDEKLAEVLEEQKKLEATKIEVANNENAILKKQLKQMEYTEKVMEQMTPDETAEITKRMADPNYNIDDIAKAVTDKYISSSLHKNKEKEIIDSQADKIAELNKYKVAIEAPNVFLGK